MPVLGSARALWMHGNARGDRTCLCDGSSSGGDHVTHSAGASVLVLPDAIAPIAPQPRQGSKSVMAPPSLAGSLRCPAACVQMPFLAWSVFPQRPETMVQVWQLLERLCLVSWLTIECVHRVVPASQVCLRRWLGQEVETPGPDLDVCAQAATS